MNVDGHVLTCTATYIRKYLHTHNALRWSQMLVLQCYTHPRQVFGSYKHARTYSGRMLSHQMQPHPLPHLKMNEQKWNEDLSYCTYCHWQSNPTYQLAYTRPKAGTRYCRKWICTALCGLPIHLDNSQPCDHMYVEISAFHSLEHFTWATCQECFVLTILTMWLLWQ